MLDKIIWGNTIENWGISLFIILITVIVTKLVATFNKRVLQNFTQKTSNRVDDILYDSINSPILFAIMLGGIWIAIHRLVYPARFVTAVDSAYKILIVLNATWFFARLVNGVIQMYWMNRSDKTNRARRQVNKMMPIIKRTILTIVWIIGIVMALSNIGVNISALLGTLGIGGIAFALAAQDTVKNIFGAFTIFTDRPFNIGDTVRIDAFEGTIIDIGVRSTTMRDYDKRLITFPNYKVADANIINISSEPMRRVVMNIALNYDTTAEGMQKAIDILKEFPSKIEFVSPKDIVTNFSEFRDSSLILNFIYFIENKGDIGKVTSNVNMEILSSFNKAGLKFAYPSQSIYIEKEPKEAEEEKPEGEQSSAETQTPPETSDTKNNTNTNK